MCFSPTVHFLVALPIHLNLLLGVHSIYVCLKSIHLKWSRQVRETKSIGQFSIDNPCERFVLHCDNRSVKRHPAVLNPYFVSNLKVW